MLLFVVLPTIDFNVSLRKSASTTFCSGLFVVAFGFLVGFPIWVLDAVEVEVRGAALDLVDALEVINEGIDE